MNAYFSPGHVVIPLFGAMLFFCLGIDAEPKDEPVSRQVQYWPGGGEREVRTFNDLGDVISSSFYRQDGTLERKLEYDRFGNRIFEANYGRKGQLKESVDGWSAMRWKYEGGSLAAEAYYGSDGELKEVKYYNKEGDLVDKNYYGGEDPDPSEEFAPSSVFPSTSINFYDNTGRREGGVTMTGTDIFPFSVEPSEVPPEQGDR